MSKDEPLLSNCPLETAEPSRNFTPVPGYKKKDKKKTRKEKKNEQRRNPSARTSLQDYFYAKITRRLRGDPQHEGLRRLQPRAHLSKLDCFYAGITSTRLHRPCPITLTRAVIWKRIYYFHVPNTPILILGGGGGGPRPSCGVLNYKFALGQPLFLFELLHVFVDHWTW